MRALAFAGCVRALAFAGCVAAAVALLAGPGAGEARASSGPSGRMFGAGVVLGEPTGPTIKLWLNGRDAIQANASWSLAHESFTVTTDWVFHLRSAQESRPNFSAMPYLGVGGRVRLREKDDAGDRSDNSFGMRVPLGVTMLLNEVPIDLFLEIVPGTRILPDTRFELDAGIGARFYFF